jgi:hypothetical protein
MINGSIGSSRKMKALSSDTSRMLFCMTIPHLDRDGRITADPDEYLAIVAPILRHLSDDDATAAFRDFVESQLAIVCAGVDGKDFIEFTGFQNEQSFNYDRERPSKFTPDNSRPSPEYSGPSPENSCLREVKLIQDKLREDINAPAREEEFCDSSPQQPQAPALEPKRTEPWLVVAREYRERYLVARAGEVCDWQAHAKHRDAFGLIAREAASQKCGFEVALSKAFDSFFADDWCKGHDYPPGALSKAFGKYFAPPKHKPTGMPPPTDRDKFTEESYESIIARM